MHIEHLLISANRRKWFLNFVGVVAFFVGLSHIFNSMDFWGINRMISFANGTIGLLIVVSGLAIFMKRTIAAIIIGVLFVVVNLVNFIYCRDITTIGLKGFLFVLFTFGIIAHIVEKHTKGTT